MADLGKVVFKLRDQSVGGPVFVGLLVVLAAATLVLAGPLPALIGGGFGAGMWFVLNRVVRITAVCERGILIESIQFKRWVPWKEVLRVERAALGRSWGYVVTLDDREIRVTDMACGGIAESRNMAELLAHYADFVWTGQRAQRP